MVKVCADKLTDEQSAWNQISNEADAVVEYEVAADNAKDPKTREAMLHNARDEKEHVGLMARVANEQNPETKKDVQKGYDEYDHFIKKSISQCLKERRERGTTEIFQKASIDNDQLERRDILLRKKLARPGYERMDDSNREEYYERTSGPYKSVDPQYLGNDPFGYYYIMDKMRQALFGKDGGVRSIDLGGSENFSDRGAISEDDKYAIDEELRGLTAPRADFDTLRKIIIKEAFEHPPDVNDKKEMDMWVNNLHTQLANLSFDAMDGKIDGWGKYAGLLMNIPGMTLRGKEAEGSTTPAWGRRYFKTNYKRPIDIIKGYNKMGASDKSAKWVLSESINRINDLRAMVMNLMVAEDLAKKDYARLEMASGEEGSRTAEQIKALADKKALVDKITAKKSDVNKLLLKYLNAQLTDRILSKDPREEIEQDLRNGQPSAVSDLYKFIEHPPSYTEVFGEPKIKSQFRSARSPFWTAAIDILGEPPSKEDAEKMVNAIEAYKSAKNEDEAYMRLPAVLDSLKWANLSTDEAGEFLDLVMSVPTGDTSKGGFTPKSKPTNAIDYSTWYLKQMIREQNKEKAAHMLAYIAKGRGNPEKGIPADEKIAEELKAIDPVKLDQLEIQLKEMYANGELAYDGDELDFDSVNDRIYTDDDYKTLERLAFQPDNGVPYPEPSPESQWNLDANDAVDNPKDADKDPDPMEPFLLPADRQAREEQRKAAYWGNLDPEVFSAIDEDTTDSVREDLNSRYYEVLKKVKNDPELADNLIKFIGDKENGLGDSEFSRYGGLVKKLAKVRAGDGFAMPNLYRDIDLAYVLGRYSGLSDEELENLGVGIDIDHRRPFFDPSNAQLRTKVQGFNGLGVNMDQLYELSGAPRIQSRQISSASKDIDDIMKLNEMLGGRVETDEEGNRKIIPGKIDISRLDPTVKGYNDSVQAAKMVNGRLGIYALLPTEGAADKVFESFRNFMSKDNAWTANGPGFKDYGAAGKKFYNDLESDIENAENHPWYNEQLEEGIENKNISRGSSRVVNSLEGLLEWKDLMHRANIAMDTIFGDDVMHEFPRAHVEKDLKNRGEGKRYDTVTNLASRLTSDIVGRGDAFINGGDDVMNGVFKYRPKSKARLNEFVSTIEPIAEKFQTATPEERAVLLSKIPGLPKELGGAFTDEELEENISQSRFDEALAMLYGDNPDVIKDIKAKITGLGYTSPAQLNDLISDMRGYAQDTGYWSPVLEEGKKSPNIEDVIGFTAKHGLPNEDDEFERYIREQMDREESSGAPIIQDTSDANSPGIKATNGKRTSDKFLGTYIPKEKKISVEGRTSKNCLYQWLF